MLTLTTIFGKNFLKRKEKKNAADIYAPGRDRHLFDNAFGNASGLIHYKIRKTMIPVKFFLRFR